MTCDTCGHTMQGLPTTPNRTLDWCPRCGTLKAVAESGFTTTKEPNLVGRCREFGPVLLPSLRGLWHRLGIEESIHRPEERQAP
jgi:hypothetical protein